MADIQSSSGVEEDMKSNELTWILVKIANHLTAGDALAPEDFALSPGQRLSIGMNQEYLLHQWNMLMVENVIQLYCLSKAAFESWINLIEHNCTDHSEQWHGG